MTSLTIGLVQMTSAIDIDTNQKEALRLIAAAVDDGAELVSLPEIVNICQKDRTKLMDLVQLETADPFLQAMRDCAARLKIWLHLGSLAIGLPDRQKMANRAYMISPTGELVARYDKIHMFDVDLDHGESYRESDNFQAGNQAIMVDTPWGGIGLTICYDVRFGYLHRSLAQQGAKIIMGSAAFTHQTGVAHWHVLQRARAIENGCFMVSAAQTGHHQDGRDTYGHSLIVDPWGKVLLDAGDQIGAFTCAVNLDQVGTTRSMIPSLKDTNFAVTPA